MSAGEEKENIWLDAVLVGVLHSAAFRARLENGHEVVAYLPRNEADKAEGLETGRRVRLCMSPFDMSRGRIVLSTRQDES